MGFTDFSDYLNEITQNGKYKLSPFGKTGANAGAGLANMWYELYTATGLPAAGPLSGAAGTGTQMKQSVQGAGLDIGVAVTPDTRHLLSLQAVTPTATMVPGHLLLVDFLVYWPALVVTAPATVLLAAALPRYTDGKGVFPIVVVQTAEGAAQPALTLTCTFNDDTQAALPYALTAPGNSSPVSTLHLYNGYPFGPLPAGKLGVKSIDSYTIAAGTTGTVAFMLVKLLAALPLPAVSTLSERDCMNQLPGLTRIYDDALLGFLYCPGGNVVANPILSGAIGMGWG